ncbi:hypothetical protein [Paraburkholderia sp. JPY419]|uniref:hypothetical protein n=1 Tax=Paraburkholderia sp. JPY419 TaxID=667660 RepID=UPI003D193C71
MLGRVTGTPSGPDAMTVSPELNRAATVAVRAGRALAVCQNDPASARAWLAAQSGANDPAIAIVSRAASVITTGVIEPPDDYARALADAVIRRSALGRIEAIAPFYRVEFNEPLMRASDDATGFWIQEGMEIPALEGIDAFVISRIPVTKIGALTVFSDEFVQRAGPRTDAVIRRCVENALIRRLDASLLDGQTGDASRPPSLIDSTTSGTGNAAEDLGAAFSTLPEEYGDALVLVVSPWSVPALIGSGAADAATLNARTGGLLSGFPCVVSAAVPPGAVAWIVPPLIQLADYGVTVGTSTAPVVRVDTGDEIELHSCWQENLATVRGMFHVGWRKLEPAAAGMIVNALPATIRPLAPKAKRTVSGEN